MNTISASAWLVERARAIGFDMCGVAEAAKFPELAGIDEWLARGYGGEMAYLSDPRRVDPQRVMPGTRSVIVCALNYNVEKPYSTLAALQQTGDDPRGWISRYAWGEDYHEVLGKKLQLLADTLPDRFTPPFDTRVYVDTGPLQERILAKQAGLGWIGKNTLLLNQKIGSLFFLGIILTTLDLEPTLGEGAQPAPDLCGSCTRCIQACPTDALVQPYVLDARKCISYLTIELRGSIAEELREPIGWHVFGCDICQDVCPWNRRAPFSLEGDFQPRNIPPVRVQEVPDVSGESAKGAASEDSLFLPKLEWLASISEEEFRVAFRGSPVKRTKWRGLVRNACLALGNCRPRNGTQTHARVTTLLNRLAHSPEAIIAESAQWALSRIQSNAAD